MSDIVTPPENIESRASSGEATVKSHLARAQLKLGTQNRVGIGIIADRAGLLPDA